MTEAEWVASSDPTLMLEFMRSTGNDRQLRLFAVSCCRGIWRLIEDKRSQKAVETAERFADGTASPVELLSAAQTANEATYPDTRSASRAVSAAAKVAHLTAYSPHTAIAYLEAPEHARPAFGGYDPEAFSTPDGFAGLSSLFAADASAIERLTEGEVSWELFANEEFNKQSAYLRDIFGNPFRPVAFDPNWRTSNVVSLAHSMYESRDFSTMPILSDALQDAGCENEDILNHCRSAGPHVRGCWVVDLILGKN